MVLLTDCIACQWGDHAAHTEVIQAVPKGMIGGTRCPCQGECVERGPNKRAMQAAGLDAEAPSGVSESLRREVGQ